MMRPGLLLLLAGCATTSPPGLLPPLPSQWQRSGSEAQIVIQKRLELKRLNNSAGISWRRYEQRFHRRGGELRLELPVHPDRRVLRAGLRTLSTSGAVAYRDLSQFVYTDRKGQPLLEPERAAFLSIRIHVEPESLVDWAIEGVDRRAHWLPALALDGPYPIESGVLQIHGDPSQEIEVRFRGIQPKLSLEAGVRSYHTKGLRAHLPHPWSPAPLGERALRPRFRRAQAPHLVERMTSQPPIIYDLRPSPTLKAGPSATPCVLLPWDLPEPSPMDVLLTTAIPKPKGGLQATIDPVTARGFHSCRLVEPGAPADVSLRPESGVALWRFKSVLSPEGEAVTDGRVQLGGVAAYAARRGLIDLKQFVKDRLGQKMGPIHIVSLGGGAGTGPVSLAFRLRFRPTELAPQDWLAAPYPALDWLRPQTRFLGPLVDEERIDWEFQWGNRSSPLPPTHSKTVTEPELVGSATWTLGSVRSVRFVQELRWQLKPHFARPVVLRRSLDQLRLSPLPLER